MPVEGLDEFRRAAEALAGAEKVVLSEVGKSMRAVAKPIVQEIRSEVRSSKGESPRGLHASEIERRLYVVQKARKSAGWSTPRRTRAIAKRIARFTSLREAIAAAAGSTVSSTEKKIALAFKVRASQLPPSQRKLPRRWDSETGWKHPVFGNRNNWVSQRGNPYFRKTIFRSKDQVTSGVVAAMDVAAHRIIHPDEGGVL